MTQVTAYVQASAVLRFLSQIQFQLRYFIINYILNHEQNMKIKPVTQMINHIFAAQKSLLLLVCFNFFICFILFSGFSYQFQKVSYAGSQVSKVYEVIRILGICIFLFRISNYCNLQNKIGTI